MTENNRKLTDADLQLFLAGTLPWGKAFLLRIALLISPDVRLRIRALKSENDRYVQQEFPGLKARVIPRGRRTTETDNAVRPGFTSGLRL